MASVFLPFFSGRGRLRSMKQDLSHMCRDLAFRRKWRKLHPHFTIINDPKKLAQLSAEVERRRLLPKSQRH